MGIGIAGVIWTIERRRNQNVEFNAESARKLSKEWNKKDAAQMNRIERKIKACCKRGRNELTLLPTPNAKVIELLKNRGYEVVMGYAGVVIKW